MLRIAIAAASFLTMTPADAALVRYDLTMTQTYERLIRYDALPCPVDIGVCRDTENTVPRIYNGTILIDDALQNSTVPINALAEFSTGFLHCHFGSFDSCIPRSTLPGGHVPFPPYTQVLASGSSLNGGFYDDYGEFVVFDWPTWYLGKTHDLTSFYDIQQIYLTPGTWAWEQIDSGVANFRYGSYEISSVDEPVWPFISMLVFELAGVIFAVTRISEDNV